MSAKINKQYNLKKKERFETSQERGEEQVYISRYFDFDGGTFEYDLYFIKTSMEIYIVSDDESQWESLKKWFEKNLAKEFPKHTIEEVEDNLFITLEKEEFKPSLKREEKEEKFEKLIFDNLAKTLKKLKSNYG